MALLVFSVGLSVDKRLPPPILVKDQRGTRTYLPRAGVLYIRGRGFAVGRRGDWAIMEHLSFKYNFLAFHGVKCNKIWHLSH